ncbi:MAG: PIN domain-containing protein [Rhodoferax sp.]|nr:PIN domain-containing protein [Rhodoferax sp.]MDP3654211.1 PIN domain-containing protein [Rhodoferax sp.]
MTKPTSAEPMAARSFIDTNVLVYAEASDAPAKQRAALAVLKQLYEGAEGVLSTQVLQEYCNVALKKLRLPVQHVRAQLDLYEQFEVIQVTPAIIRAGLDLHQTRSVSFYDALILASAQTAGCSVLFSEDMNTGEIMGGVRIVNPFTDLQAA